MRCHVAAEGDAVIIEITNAGRLPEGFDLGRLRSGVSGLSLVRSLLPRRSASLQLSVADGRVRTRIELRPPSVKAPG